MGENQTKNAVELTAAEAVIGKLKADNKELRKMLEQWTEENKSLQQSLDDNQQIKTVTLSDLTKEEVRTLAIELSKMGVGDQVEEIHILSARILAFAVEFLKMLGLLNDFTETLDDNYKAFFLDLYKNRPEEFGGNPFA